MSTKKQIMEMAIETISQLETAIVGKNDRLIEMYVYDLQLLKGMAEIHSYNDIVEYIDRTLNTLRKTGNDKCLNDMYNVISHLNSIRYFKMISNTVQRANVQPRNNRKLTLPYYMLFKNYSEFSFNDSTSQTYCHYTKYGNIWCVEKYDLGKYPSVCEKLLYETNQEAIDSLPYLHGLEVLVKNENNGYVSWEIYTLID